MTDVKKIVDNAVSDKQTAAILKELQKLDIAGSLKSLCVSAVVETDGQQNIQNMYHCPGNAVLSLGGVVLLLQEMKDDIKGEV